MISITHLLCFQTCSQCLCECIARYFCCSRGTKLGQLVNVFSCCPGLVDTDLSFLGRPVLKKTPEQGADTPVWLALYSPKGGSGKFWSDRNEKEFQYVLLITVLGNGVLPKNVARPVGQVVVPISGIRFSQGLFHSVTGFLVDNLNFRSVSELLIH